MTCWCRQCNAKGDILSYITLTTGKSVKEQLAEAGLLDKPEGKNGRGSKEQFIWKQSQPGDKPDDPASLHYLYLDTSANPLRKTGIQTSNAEEGAMKGRAVS